MPTVLDRYLKQVNPEYQYKSKDLQPIILSRVSYLLEQNPNLFRKKIFVSTAITIGNNNPKTLESFLIQAKNNSNGVRIILIPCQFDDNHWVGILLEIEPNNKIKAEYLDSDLIEGQEIDSSLLTQFNNALPDSLLQIKDCWLQEDSYNAGTYVVENLLRAAQCSPGTAQLDTNTMRALHLQSLEKYKPDFYMDFKQRQRKDRPTILPSTAANVTPVSDSVDLLFTTLYKLNIHLEELFSDQVNENAMAALSSSSQELFQTVCDEHGILRLRLLDAANNKRVAKFLPVKEWKNNKLGFIWDYSVAESVAVTGSLASYATGIGLGEAVQAYRTAGTFIQGARGFAAILNPWVLGPTVALTIASAASTTEAREFARQINTAVQKADTGDETQLLEAKRILEQEFKQSEFVRGIRWFSTSNDQYQFAHLLLVQIKIDLKIIGFNPYNQFQTIYQEASNQFIRGMALIGQINALVKSISSEQDLNARTNLGNQLNSKVVILNNNHRDLTQQYLHSVVQAYRLMFAKVQNREFLKSEREFEPVRGSIDKLIKFRDLRVLRFMRPHGEIAEVMFTFLQTLCYVIYEEHYKEISDSAKTNKKGEAASRNAVDKINSCFELIRIYENKLEEYKSIIDIIEEYSLQYLEMNEKKMQEQVAALAQHPGIQWVFERQRLTCSQIGDITEKAFEGVNASSDEISAKQQSLQARCQKE